MQQPTETSNFKIKLWSSLAVTGLYLIIFYLGVSHSLIFSISSPAQQTGQFLIWPVISKLVLFLLSHTVVLTAIIILSYNTASALIPINRKKLTPLASTFISWMIIQSITLYCVFEYPHLDMSIISGSYEHDAFRRFTLWAITGSLIFIILTTLLKSLKNRKKAISTALCVLFLGSPLIKQPQAIFSTNTTTKQQPNIILIGFDSISDQQVDQYSQYMPTLTRELTSSVRFHNTYTAIGRTFPSWNAILSGSYPATTDIRENLDDFQTDAFRNVTVKRMLPTQLKESGYTTLYAQDERRFNNINEDYGFDKIIGPPIGVTDLIIPSLQNNVVSAYFISSPIGRWMFPDLYGNRVADLSYKPDQFIQEVLKETAQHTEQSLFLAVHLCMAHFPYTWSQSPVGIDSELKLHQLAANQADRQLHLLLKGLHEQGITQNAIIVYLSDHGEGIENSKTWLKQETPESISFNRMTRGHGNSLMVPDQINSFLAFQLPNKAGYKPKSIQNLTSLVDIKPTLLDTIKQSSNTKDDGISLLPAITSENPVTSDRMLFMESAITAALPLPGTPANMIADKYKDQAKDYTVKPNGLLVLTTTARNQYLHNKQFGVINKNFLLISDCQRENQKLIFIDIEKNVISLPPDTIAESMITGLQGYMGNLWCAQPDWKNSTVMPSSDIAGADDH